MHHDETMRAPVMLLFIIFIRIIWRFELLKSKNTIFFHEHGLNHSAHGSGDKSHSFEVLLNTWVNLFIVFMHSGLY